MEFDPEDYDKELEALQAVESEKPPEVQTPPPAEEPSFNLPLTSNSSALDDAKLERDSRIGQANLLQGITGIGTALASQGRVGPEESVFNAARKSAEKGVDEALKEKESNRKAVSDYIRQKATAAHQKQSQDNSDRAYNESKKFHEDLTGNREESQDARADALLLRATKTLDENNIIKTGTQNLFTLKKGVSLLDNPDVPLTPQSLADVEQDLVNGMSYRANGGTEGKIKRTEIDTVRRKVAGILQKFGADNSSIDLRKTDPQTVEQVRKTLKAIRDDTLDDVKMQTNNIIDNQEAVFGTNPRYVERIKKLRESKNKQLATYSLGGSGDKGASGLTPQQRQARILELRAKLAGDHAAE